MRISVVGCGYLGSTHAACMAELGHDVLGVDTDALKVSALRSGSAHFYEDGLNDLLAKHTASGKLRFSQSFAEAADFADVHFLTVGTPKSPGSNAHDLSFVLQATQQLARHLRRPSLIVGKSTVPAGTASRLARFVRKISPMGESVQLAWNPEFVRESCAVEDTLRPNRIVVGIDGGTEAAKRAEQTIRCVYARVIETGTPLIVTDLATAELTKIAANAFLATKISFINAIAELSEAAGADIQQLTAALALDPRIGAGALHSGVGFGGGCLPKDLRGLIWCAEQIGAERAASLLRQVDAVNTSRRNRAIKLVFEECGSDISGQRIAVWGAAFKPNTDDIRESPALAVADELHRRGAHVTVYDPVAADNARAAYPHLRYAGSAKTAITGARVLLHLTEWAEFSKFNPIRLTDTGFGSPRCVIDGRGTLDADRWRAAGWTYRALGTTDVHLSAHSPAARGCVACALKSPPMSTLTPMSSTTTGIGL
ncbi:UDP-glucose/GDP-mannose dehydrogenase family protein [Mycobacterium simiae]|uniref:UDP-glucose 6-dehydrogenase n=1 Tax=Mycobacterium simiae TaxID=1784 RepID=A0A5B1BNG5_MYCSI|nr:UDP-glucose/GDP-mannose dehydrogenase family protein [Mycobacterium simiae]KAA1249946.1 UDP-glucose/GDP-mannose dehydrogenase family protein [Mycobacterium simiae]